MAAFTAQDVKTLREKTGCGMMDCKKALTNADGDMDKAVDFLREQGLAKQAKKAGRIAAEGVAYACTNDDLSVGVVVEVNAETDFVAKNDSFMDFVKACANTIIEQNPADVEALLTLKATGSEQTIAEMLQEKVLTIGENIQIRRFERMEGACVAYVHAGGKIGKFYKENCLLDQEFVKDNKINIKQYTQNTAKELGGSIEIKKFVRFEKGEGIEKRQDDFAAEVASMVK